MKKHYALLVALLATPLLQGDVGPEDDKGFKVAFTSERDGNSEIYVMNSDGTGQTRLTNNKAGDFGAAFSPDGSKIAFSSDRDGASHIYIMNADGTGLKRLSNSNGYEYSPVWSPDGSKIVFMSARDIDRKIALVLSNIYVMNSDGTGEKQLTNLRANNRSPRFSPDGKKIVYYSLGRIGAAYSMNLDGTEKKRLESKDEPGWKFSPDGSKIVYSDTNATDPGNNVYVMNADGSQVKQLTTVSGYSPVFSPDGSKIVFTSWREPHYGIFIMNTDGTGVKQLTDSSSRNSSPTVPLRPKKK